MADFQSQVMGLTDLTIDASSTVPSRSEFSQFLNDGVIDVTNRWLAVKPQDINDFIRESSEQTANGSLDLNGAKILSVIREDGVTSNNWRQCSQISPSQQYMVTNTESLSFASKFHPTYMVGDNGEISVFPAPGSDPNTFKVYYVNNSPEETDGTALDHASTGIKYFPNDKVYLVVLYASMRSVQVKMGSTTISDLSINAVSPDVPSLVSVTFTSIDSDLDSAIGSFFTAATIGSASTYTGSAPNYSKLGSTAVSGVVAFNSYWTLGDFGDSDPGELSVSAVVPDVPSLTTVTFTSIDSDKDASLPTYLTATVSAGNVFGANTAPSYSDHSLTGQTTFNNYWTLADFGDSDPGSLSISAVPPDTVSLTDITFSSIDSAITSSLVPIAASTTLTGAAAASNVPTYTPPTVTASSTELTEMEAISGSALGTDADFIDFEMWFAALGEMIEDEEDVELAQAQIGKISTYIQAYGQAMQSNLHDFNEANVKFQTSVQESMAQFQSANQMAIADAERSQNRQLQNSANDMKVLFDTNAQAIQKYQSEIQSYQQSVADEVQEYQQNLAGDLQVWQAERTTDLQQYATDIQNELNDFNKENAAYQAQLQVSVQNAQLENQDEQFKVQKYQAEYAGYTAEVNEQVQAYTQNLQADGVGYQWLQDQYNRLKAEYDAAFMIAAPKPPPQPQQRARR